MSTLQGDLWDKLDQAFDAIEMRGLDGTPQVGRRNAAVIRKILRTVGHLLLERRRELTALPRLLAASTALLASMDASISLADWADTPEPPPEIDRFRSAIAQAEADAAADPT